VVALAGTHEAVAAAKRILVGGGQDLVEGGGEAGL
jgi:hypothetical protein